MNCIIISGRVASDIETRRAGDNSVTNFRVISTEFISGTEYTETHQVTVWGDGAAKYLSEHVAKGDYVECRGRMHYGRYEKEGAIHYTAEVVVDGKVNRVSQAEKNRR